MGRGPAAECADPVDGVGILPCMVSDRLQAWVRGHFSPSEVLAVLDLLTALPVEDPDDPAGDNERIQAAVVLLSAGNSRLLLEAAVLAEQDWRDVLVAAQLANSDWADRLDSLLGDDPLRQDAR